VELDAQALDCVVGFVYSLKQLAFLVEAENFEPKPAAMEEPKYRSDAIAECSQLLAGEARLHAYTVYQYTNRLSIPRVGTTLRPVAWCALISPFRARCFALHLHRELPGQ
jgi:hypothetical protein